VAVSALFQLPHTYRAFYSAFASLHPFQQEVIAPLLSGQDLILQAATGSGKTEAVLAPCLERVLTAPGAAAILYVVPTRALVHDLRRRLQPIVHERLGLRLGVRTGDVKRMPAGQADVLLTTPESLDVMLGSPNRDVQAFLQRVSVLIVDEVHQLIQGYRGRQLAYLLQRLEPRQPQRLQKIALSATLAGPEAIRAGLALRADAVWVASGVQRQMQPRLVHLKRESDELAAFIDDLALRFGARKVLLFANSRSRCDRLFALLRQRGYFQQATYLHYSNLKLSQRQEVERQFQRRAQALCIATSTLELGIDVGDVDTVVLYEPPESVTTFLQRLGRSNRQSQTTTFWGVCRGPQAGEQLLQFLALYTLAQQGKVEKIWPVCLPSVLVQQVLSSLYERKHVSLPALQARFPQQAETLVALLPHLVAQRWLRPVNSNGGPYRGGWRYGRALRERVIWSNFPDNDIPYTLQIDEQAVADLPTAVVRQLDVGDQVNLAGRCIRILDIEEGERKVVRATSADAAHDKELVWLGSGPLVSWEVAHAVQSLLQPDYEPDTTLGQGLFARARTLLHQQRQAARRRVVLHNGIELSRTPLGLYRYATYLGTVGNFIVQRTIETYYGPRLQDFSCSADALAVVCSHRLDLQPLPLPVGREAFRHWVSENLRALQALLALNVFSRALPPPLRVEEVTDLLWDERLSHAFDYYRQHTSEIAMGDPRHLEWDAVLPEDERPQPTLLRQGPEPALLVQEKARLGLTANTTPLLPAVPIRHQRPRALTGTMMGSYIEHQQCDRLLSFDLLPSQQQPPKRTLADSALGAARAAQGRSFEEGILTQIVQPGVALYRIAEQDDDGRRLSLRARQERSFACLAALIQRCAADTNSVRHAARQPVGYLAQAVLILPALLGTDNAVAEQVEGIGIPDLIEVTLADAEVWLTVADIKDSAAPRYSQMWQVAFYAALLHACLQHVSFALPVRVASCGVVFARPQLPHGPPTRHTFDLEPYLAAFPVLLRRVCDLLSMPILDASWQLQAHCASCTYFDSCYRQALSTDDVMLLPHLTPGEHAKLRSAGLHTLPQVSHWGRAGNDKHPAFLSRQQATRLQARIRALVDNRVEVVTPPTSLYPANISTALFVHLLPDPHSGRPRAWGLLRLPEQTVSDTTRCWVAAAEADIHAAQQAFVAHLRAWWQEAIVAGRGPHLFTFGAGILQLLQEMMQDSEAPEALSFLWSADRPRHTDLRQLLVRHFALPLPLRYTLATVGRVWGFSPELALPPYFLQDETEEVQELLLHPCLDEVQVQQLQGYLQTSLALQQQLWQVCAAHLRSDWQQDGWVTPRTDAERQLECDTVAFLDQQQRWRERDILALQQLPLAERVERYRALGPLMFAETTLDSEGHFLYHFRLPVEAHPARFRPGDFLKLNPVGSPEPQEGASVILAQYAPHAQELAVIARQGRLAVSPRVRYCLDEDLEDWTTPRVIHAVREALTPGKHPQLTALLTGALPLHRSTAGQAWGQRWLQHVSLNARQQEALLLPFRSRLGLIEGPPGTGKTHLLACMLMALIYAAAQAGHPLRLAVSALTHQAIDNVLLKVQQLLQAPIGHHFPGRCLKWGRRLALATDDPDAPALTYVENAQEVLQTPYLILGATGFGLYQLFDSQSGNFPAFFDWVIFDEASQVLLPQALLSLVYGKGQYVFCGDVRQLPPVVLGPQSPESEALPDRSILAHLLSTYDATVRVRLNETYRLNRELCHLPSRLWYEGDLRPTAAQAEARLTLPPMQHADAVDAILAPQHPVTLVEAEHTGDHQQSLLEAEIVATLAARLLLDYGLTAERLAIVAPHRAQNNTIAQCLARLLAQRQAVVPLPVIDTVERLQGAERDVLLFSLTTSDPDHRENPFLNNPNRFNVAITRARHKLIVVGSRVFFTQVPRTAVGLQAHYGFRAFYDLCRQQGSLFTWPVPAIVQETEG
jgi:superfamily II DNA/RNA helicase/predicted RecB family nuclease